MQWRAIDGAGRYCPVMLCACTLALHRFADELTCGAYRRSLRSLSPRKYRMGERR